MLILQIALGIVLGGFLLAYWGEILTLGVGAILFVVAIALVGLGGIFIYEAITFNVVLTLLAIVVVIFLTNKLFPTNWYLKKLLRKQIKDRENLGYESIALKEKLKIIEADELKANIKAEELKSKKIAMNTDYKTLIKSSGKAKEIARRRSLGYDK